MCQLKELGGLRCDSKIEEKLEANQFQFNQLVVEGYKKNGLVFTVEKAELVSKHQAMKLSQVDSSYQKSLEYVSEAERHRDKIALSLATSPCLGRVVLTLDEVKHILAENDDSYQDAMSRLDDLRSVAEPGPVVSLFDKAQRNSIRKDALAIMDSKYEEASAILSTGFEGSPLQARLNAKVKESEDKSQSLYSKLEKKHYMKHFNKNIASTNAYKVIAKQVENSRSIDLYEISCDRDQLMNEYRISRSYSKVLKQKISSAEASGNEELFIALSKEYESNKIERIKTQYNNIKSSGKKPRELIKDLDSEYSKSYQAYKQLIAKQSALEKIAKKNAKLSKQ